MSITVIPGRPQVDDDALAKIKKLLQQIEAGEVRSVCYVGLSDNGCSFGFAGQDELLNMLGATHLLSHSIENILNSIAEEV